LIEGAADGKGLGHQFLRHVERARVLAILLDLAPYGNQSPENQLEIILGELGKYKPELLNRPRVLISSKHDVAQHDPLEGSLVISSVVGEGLDKLVTELQVLVSKARDEEIDLSEKLVIHRPTPKGIAVIKEGETFVVVGRAAERAVSLNDLTNIEALEYAQNSLTKLGVDKALKKAGVKNGDIVRIGELVFDYSNDDNFLVD